MGQRGRLPIPAELNALRGNRSNRKSRKIQPVDDNPVLAERPRDMAEEVERWWEMILRECAALQTLRASDSAVVLLLADALESYHRLNGEFRGKEVLVHDKTGKIYRNPRFTILSKQRDVAIRLLAQLGMTPSARTRLLNPGSDRSGAAANRPGGRIGRYLAS